MSDILISLILVLVGFGLMIIPVNEGINVTGYFLFIAGVILGFVLKSAYMDISTGEIYSKKERYFPHARRDELKRALTSPACFCSKGEDEGNSLRLDVYYNHNKIIIQLLEYVPYSYEPCSKFHEHEYQKGASFLQK